MGREKRIRVLVVDDSIVFREVLSRGISSDLSIEVVATAIDPFDARDKILKYKPDVMTCDVQMPKMNGIEFIKKLLPQYQLPVVVVSGVSDAVFDAMNVGAVEFVTKPDVKSPKGVKNFIHELIEKIKIAVNAKVSQNEGHVVQESVGKLGINSHKIIAIGASTGGTNAILEILKGLPLDIPGIVIVQHIPPVFSRMFAERVNNTIGLSVKEASSGDYVEKGTVLIAPGGQHMQIKKIGDRYRVECFKGKKVNGHCPSVDVLFESVAREVRCHAIGVILTGMGYDGAKGLLMMKRKGAKTIGQDEKSSVVYGMPRVAYNIGAVEKQAPIENISKFICGMLR